MRENLLVYEALRENILHKEDSITTSIIYMYVTYFALLAIGFVWNHWISLISFIDLIVFQSMINSNQWAVLKSSYYIKIFFENERNDIHWETLHGDKRYKLVYDEVNRNVGWYFCKYGSSFLSVISFLAILFSNMQICAWDFEALFVSAKAQIVLSFILCIVTVYINLQYFHMRNEENDCVSQKLFAVIHTFYENECKK